MDLGASTGLLRACACWESNNHFRDTLVLFTPSKEVLSALPCEASKNPPTASWSRSATSPSFNRDKIIKNEKQTTPKCFACSRPNVGVPNQFQAQPVENVPAFLTASRPDAPAEHDP